MMKGTNKKERIGLPGGPNEQFTYVTGVFQQDMYHVPKAQLGNKGKREFIKKYKETDINRLKHYQDKNPKFRDLSVDELENFGVLDNDKYDIFTSSYGRDIPLGRNRRFGIQWDDGDEYAEILKSNPLWKEIYKKNKKGYKLENLINRLKKKEYSGNKDYSLTPAIREELNYLQNLKEGDEDFFRKGDTDVLENIILKEYNISGYGDPEVLKRRKKFKRSAFDFAKELSTKYIYNKEILPLQLGGKVKGDKTIKKTANKKYNEQDAAFSLLDKLIDVVVSI